MGLLKNFFGSFKKHEELELAKNFKAEYEANNMENMKSIVDKFVDHYIDIPFDLSDVMFILTANNIEDIPSPLRDRFGIVNQINYTTF